MMATTQEVSTVQRHRIDLVSAFFRLLFAGAGVAILAGSRGVSLHYLSVLGPLVIVAFGLVLVAATLRRPPHGREAPEPMAAGDSASPVTEELPEASERDDTAASR
jgi:hypothetical protein